MANKSIFKSSTPTVQRTDTVNKAGGVAYSLPAENALCQYVVTGTFNQTYYASAGEQLDAIKTLVDGVRSPVLAKIAVYGHQQARMKDVPAYLVAVLAARGETDLLRKVFPQVITNVKMLLNFVQIVRSGVTGRKSFGTAVKRLIQEWITNRSNDKIFIASIGHDKPSLADVIKMVHPKPEGTAQNALFGYLLGKDYSKRNLPTLVKQFEAFKKDSTGEIPDVPFQALSNFSLSTEQWKQIGRNMPWNALRLNLNQLQRHNVFNDKEYVTEIAAKLSNPELVRKFNVFPYQLLTAYQNTKDVPQAIQNALQDALEVATENVPDFGKGVAVCIDLSASMTAPATGYRQGSSSVTTCRDVVALIASCVARKNSDCEVIAWASNVQTVKFNARDSVVTNATKFGQINVGGGTNAQLSIQQLNRTGHKGDLIIVASDTESWMDTQRWGGGTGMAQEWAVYKKRNPKAKLVCINITPQGTVQVPNSKDVMNIGGFNDSVFNIIDYFAKHGSTDFAKVVQESVDL